MILRELRCTKCKKKTLHSEESSSTWKCTECGKVKVSTFRTNKKRFKKSEVYTQLYKGDDNLYFEDLISGYIIKLDDIKKLLEDKENSIPVYRLSKFGINIK